MASTRGHVVHMALAAFVLSLGTQSSVSGTPPTFSSPPPFHTAVDPLPTLGGFNFPSRIEINKTIPLGRMTDAQVSIEKVSTTLGAAVTARTKINKVRLEGTVDDHGACSGYAEVPCLTRGLVVKVQGSNQGGRKDDRQASATLSAEYTLAGERFTGRLALDESRLFFSGVSEWGGALFGAATDFDTDSGVVSEPKLMAKYLGADFTLAASGKAGGGKAEVAYEKVVAEDVLAAAQLSSQGAMALGVMKFLPNGSIIKAKVESLTRSLSLAATIHDVIPSCRLQARVEVDSHVRPNCGVSARLYI